jgi:hypothetical protein
MKSRVAVSELCESRRSSAAAVTRSRSESFGEDLLIMRGEALSG